MANNFYCRTVLIGGGTGALDAIDGGGLNDLDFAVVSILNKVYFYTLDDDSAAAENSPEVISPDANAGTKRWILQGVNLSALYDVTNPAIRFGEDAIGFAQQASNFLGIIVAGGLRFNISGGDFAGNLARSATVRNITTTAIVPSLSPDRSDQDTGVGSNAVDELSLIAGAIEGLRLTELSSGIVPQWDTTAGITAFATGGQASAVQIISGVTEISVCATAGDSVKLPSAITGSRVTIINNGAAACDVFPATDDNLGAGVDTAVSLAAGANITYQAFNAVNWEKLQAAPSGGGGVLVQSVHVQDGTVATGTTIVPFDDTIPQITEGDEYMTLAITPTNASNILYITVTFNGFHTVTSAVCPISLYQDTTANALASGIMQKPAGNWTMVTFSYRMVAGTTSATTFRVRAGGHSAGTMTFNGVSGSGYYGGTLASSITIREETP